MSVAGYMNKLRAASAKLQAASCKKRFDIYFIYDYIGYINRKVNMKDKEIEDRSINPLIRIANTLEEILRLVKLDQKKTEERYRKYDNEDDMLDDLSKPWKETK